MQQGTAGYNRFNDGAQQQAPSALMAHAEALLGQACLNSFVRRTAFLTLCVGLAG